MIIIIIIIIIIILLIIKAYWNEHAYSIELKKALQNEKDFMNETIEDIKDMENDHKRQLNDYIITLDIERDKSRKLQEQLDFEMKLRMEDSHKKHMIEEDIRLILDEKKILNKTLYDASIELYALRAENDAIKRNMNDAYLARERVINQIKEYEHQISQYEAVNGDLRSRLYDHEIENANLKRKNDTLKEELRKPINMISMPVKRGGGTMSSSNSQARISLNAKSNMREINAKDNGDDDDFSVIKTKKLPTLGLGESSIFSRNSNMSKLSKLSAALSGSSSGFY